MFEKIDKTKNHKFGWNETAECYCSVKFDGLKSDVMVAYKMSKDTARKAHYVVYFRSLDIFPWGEFEYDKASKTMYAASLKDIREGRFVEREKFDIS